MTDFSYQLYSSRNFPPLDETLRMLADLGYAQVEGYGALFDTPGSVDMLEAALDETGLVMPTAHIAVEDLARAPADVIDLAERLGIRAIFAPFVAPGDRPTNAAGWAAFGQTIAGLGEPLWDAGLQFGWHNHDFEFAGIDGPDRPLDLLMEADERLVLELDVGWAARAEQDALGLIARHGARILAAHVKDLAPEGQNSDEDGWADVGYGVLDWPSLMAALRKAGTRYFVIEHDNPADHALFAERSLGAARTF